MPPNDEPAEAGSSSAPDLQILGDEITLQPSGYVEPEGGHEGKEEALLNQFASFRAEPLQYRDTYISHESRRHELKHRLTGRPVDSFEKCHCMFRVRAGEHITTSLVNRPFIPAFQRI